MPWRNLHFEAILFDLDGTLVDSMPLHNEAWKEIISDQGYNITNEVLKEYMGIPNIPSVEIFNKKFGWNLDPVKIAHLKEQRFLEKLQYVKVIDVTKSAVRENFEKVPMAVVTGSVKKPALELIQMLGLKKYFSVIVTAEDTQRHKPDPEPFLLAAKKLNVDPKKCLVFEDGLMGIRAAHAAGMKVVKVERAEDKPIFNLSLV